MPTRIQGYALVSVGTGVAFAYAGIKGVSLVTGIQWLVQGKNPSKLPQANAVTNAGDTGNTQTILPPLTGPGDTSAHNAGAAANQAMGKLLAVPYGWSVGAQWEDLVKLWNQESAWDNTAQNPTSTAYGIAQFLDTTWASFGAKKTSDPATQITLGLKYIKQRYGNPSAAWAHEQADNWY